MDYIHLNNLKIRGKHGVYEEERKVEQEFELHLKLGVGDTSAAAQSCELTDAVDYVPIKAEIEKIVKEKSFYLIETLADTISKKVMEDPRIQTLELTINKPEVWSNVVPGLTIFRSRN
ncbi:MAG: dihydroneopterin aldolase [Candidatus Adlerbacteria bacterium]